MTNNPNIRGSIFALEVGDIVTFPQDAVKVSYVRNAASAIGADYDRFFSVEAKRGTDIKVTRIA